MAHIHEKIDFTASVYIVHDNKVLLHMHKKLGFWLPPGGHIELDEDPNQAALREVKEETGLDVELIGNPKAQDERWSDKGVDLLPPKFLNRHYFDATKTHEHIDFVYFGRATNTDVRPEEPGGEIRWFTKEEIEANADGLLAGVRSYAFIALQELAS